MTTGSARASLDPEEVLEIFSLRPQRSKENTFVPSTAFCRELALRFKCSDRTVRDIWSRRSWGHTTRPFWTLAEIAADPATCHTLDHSVKVQVQPAKDRTQGRPSLCQSSSVPPETQPEPVQQVAEPTPGHVLSTTGENSMATSQLEGEQESRTVDAQVEAGIFARLEGSSFSDPLSGVSQHEGEQESRTGDQVEAEIFARLEGSSFSDPFADAWSQSQRYIAMLDQVVPDSSFQPPPS